MQGRLDVTLTVPQLTKHRPIAAIRREDKCGEDATTGYLKCRDWFLLTELVS